MERAVLKSKAKQAIKGNLWMIAAIFIVVFTSQMLLAYITSFVGGVVGLLLAGSITLALAMIFLELVKKHRKPQVEDLLFGFKNGNFGRGLIGYLRCTFFTFAWSLLLIVPGIIKWFSYSQMFYLMADDPKLEPSEAQARSMEMMRGHKMELFNLYLSFMPWILLVVVTLGIGLIYVLPYLNATLAAYYIQLKKVTK
ncbi:DUF975 family protein [Candidatus Saccharibacteria bacterium]|jgi:uncharacterized membrane protein|nr:DUF975 family protein [Candidatus Saccharibacteria bacterium]